MKYNCLKDNFAIGGFVPVKKGEELSRALIAELKKGTITPKGDKKMSKLSFFIGQRVIEKVEDK